jgi:O-succinylhomoserine sulfhydrylase
MFETPDDQPDTNPLLTAGLDTLAVRAGIARSQHGEHSEPIYLTSSYVFSSAEEAAARFAGTEPGNVYSRYTNPSVSTFEARLAALEGGEAAVGTASGMAAILSCCMALLKAGDEVLCSQSVFGTTTVLFSKYLEKFGLKVRFIPLTDLAGWEAALSPATKLLFCETPSNPLCQVVDIAALANIAHSVGAWLAVDNCFCTPALQKPLALGADLVIHSATKYLDGQGRCLGGAVVGSALLVNEVLGFVRTCGPSMSPFNAWVFTKGLETLSLRMKAHSASALLMAEYLAAHTQVAACYYAGLPEHPGHALAAKQQRAFGGVLSFEVKGDKAAAWRFINATRLMSLTANLGDAKTTIVHPATTTHGRLTPEARVKAGIGDNLIRIAVGLEDLADLVADLERGFAALG